MHDEIWQSSILCGVQIKSTEGSDYPHPNIFRKSSCPLPCPVAEFVLPVSILPEDAVDIVVARFLLPRPARGLDAAARGTNMPDVLVAVGGGAADDALRGARCTPGVSAISSRVLPLNTTGSVRRSSFPTSCPRTHQRGEDPTARKHGLTAAFSNCTSASPLSAKTSTRFTGASFSRACCSSPSCVSEGRFRM